MARKDNQRRTTGPKKTHHQKQHRTRRSFDPNQPESEVNQNSDDQADEARPMGGNKKSFNILVDSVPYMVKAAPFSFNGEIRYRVSFNGSPEHVFTWDSSLSQLRAIDDDSSTLPDNLEIAISERLQSKS
ncbi:MAG TPA: hypothetical protein VGQ53_15910 [Chitinophagaceae bacterium]|nr:hypothetical protein [Chitinophagaceae bacterium]